MSSDPVPSAAIYDATTGGRSVIIVTGGSTGDVLTLQANGTYIAATPAGGSLSGTGAVDNAVLRADGTGGATLQNSAFVIADNATASPNNTVNHASIQATGGTTNVSLSIVPKGTGAFCLAVPDGTATGGNARGANAVDLQASRGSATQVASGQYSGLGGFSSSSTARCSLVWGYESQATGNEAVAFGLRCVASGAAAFARNINSVASGQWSDASGLNSLADRITMRAHSGGVFATSGDAQYVRFCLRCKTTNDTPTSLYIWTSTRLTIPSGKIMFADILISGIKSDGSAAACYKRKVAIKNVAGTTALVGSAETIGTDIEDNAACDVAITADNTNDALDISVTGIAAETWRWVAVVEGLEIAYGS